MRSLGGFMTKKSQSLNRKAQFSTSDHGQSPRNERIYPGKKGSSKLLNNELRSFESEIEEEGPLYETELVEEDFSYDSSRSSINEN